MSNWKEVQEMMKQAQTPAEKQEALQALQESVSPDMLAGSLVTLSKGGQNVVRLSELVKHADNPEVFERLRDMVNGK